MSPFVLGTLVGFAFGLVIVGLLAVSAYERGFQDALQRRGHRIAELRARQVVGLRRLEQRKVS